MAISAMDRTSGYQGISSMSSFEARPRPPEGHHHGPKEAKGMGGPMGQDILASLEEMGLEVPDELQSGTQSADESSELAQALGQFMGSLMETLRQQGAGSNFGAPPDIKSDLSSLVSSLDGTDGASTTNSALNDDFQALVAALGGNTNDEEASASVTLSSLLTALQSRVPERPSVGQFLDESA